MAQVLEVNEDKRRFLVSLKPSDVRVGSWPGGQEVEERSRVLGERLQRFLAEREMVLEAEQALPPGTVVRGMVSYLHHSCQAYTICPYFVRNCAIKYGVWILQDRIRILLVARLWMMLTLQLEEDKTSTSGLSE